MAASCVRRAIIELLKAKSNWRDETRASFLQVEGLPTLYNPRTADGGGTRPSMLSALPVGLGAGVKVRVPGHWIRAVTSFTVN